MCQKLWQKIGLWILPPYIYIYIYTYTYIHAKQFFCFVCLLTSFLTMHALPHTLMPDYLAYPLTLSSSSLIFFFINFFSYHARFTTYINARLFSLPTHPLIPPPYKFTILTFSKLTTKPFQNRWFSGKPVKINK